MYSISVKKKIHKRAYHESRFAQVGILENNLK